MTSCKQDLAAYLRRSQELKIEMQQLEDHAESLKDALENNKDGQLDALKNVVRAAELELETHEASFEDAKIAVAALVENLKNLRREVKEKVAKLAALRQSCNVAKEEKERVQDKRHRIISDKNAAIARIDDDKRHRDRIREKHDQLVTRILDLTEQASIITERVPVDEGETTDSLATKLDRLKRDLQRYSDQYVVSMRLEPTMLISNNFRLGAPREQIANDASAAETKYKLALRQVQEMTTLAQVPPPIPMPHIGSNGVQIFKDTLDNRKKRWEIFRSHISSRAKAQFTYLLSERSFRGRLLANHQEKLLDLQVEPDITKDDSTGRGAKTLSGGEKSFSQICLLLALWEAMGSPIRCLDELCATSPPPPLPQQWWLCSVCLHSL